MLTAGSLNTRRKKEEQTTTSRADCVDRAWRFTVGRRVLADGERPTGPTEPGWEWLHSRWEEKKQNETDGGARRDEGGESILSRDASSSAMANRPTAFLSFRRGGVAARRVPRAGNNVVCLLNFWITILYLRLYHYALDKNK